ncbi:3-oxoacyl-[acyl-carrier-protein] synthase III C-terminal domain-containing protein [Streptomyces sp. 3214.6]|uniref:3-oxoacyl-[acyl-carrier-protein] synthase III C-terminal domain-containing protein n=1 Tax=Streptomyces sp. 3214.6 TaxID=1882757 RepID=UPI00090C364F|nr:3-oxoacyl-[acyl-carrier-protein] synthase III C-terminal domain-containing protein [Streptomyces sp. 3214.6]SHH51600.1 3-oxoacyl-[acyl-carrier-protein] synthase-3 [Streptomyces sp. 3214.6]
MLSGTLTLDAVEIFLPERTTTVEERAEAFGLSPAQVHLFRSIHGLDQLRYDPEASLYDLVLPPARKVLADVDPGTVRYVVYPHAVPHTGPSTVDPVQEMLGMLGLEHATAFALTQQNCAGTVSAIDVAGRLLQADGDPEAKALVLTGEKIFTRDLQIIFNSCVIGEAAGACLLSWNGPGDPVRSFAVRTFGEYAAGVEMTAEQHRVAGAQRPGVMAELIREAVESAGCTFDDIDIVIPTHPNRSFWGQIAQDLGWPPDKLYLENIPRYSHCLTADLMVNYVTLRDEGRLVPGRTYLFLATGIGSTFTAMVFTATAQDTPGPTRAVVGSGLTTETKGR